MTYGKWILAGEHTLTRGGTGISFPYEDVSMEIDAIPSDSLKIPGSVALSRRIEEYLGRKVPFEFKINSTIPVNSGLGSSAALAVSIANWLEENDFSKESLQLAMFIENEIHGKSSGLDVITVYHNRPIYFYGHGIFEFIESDWKPNIRVECTPGLVNTQECITRIEDIHISSPRRAADIDIKMTTAVRMARSGITESDISQVAEAMKLADSCFVEWGLYTQEMEAMKEKLVKEGAIAVKPTGGGLGGAMLGLFE